MAACADKKRIDPLQVEEAELFAALDGPVKAFRRENRRKVEEGAWHRGYRNVFVEASIRLGEGGVVEPEIGPCMSATDRNGDV
jgi:hypothetical protein